VAEVAGRRLIKTGASTGSGTYKVTRLLRFSKSPGTQTSTIVDNIGNGTLADNRGGLAFFSIKYFDDLGNPIHGVGGTGVLVVSCHLNGNPPPQGPDAAPPSVFEGITASKGFVDYWNRVAPVGGVDGGPHAIPCPPPGLAEASEPVRREGAESSRIPRLVKKRMKPHDMGSSPRRSQEKLNTTQLHVTLKEEERDRTMEFF
jgi:hypothetical protein